MEIQKSILMIISAGNFRDEEYFEPKAIFENAGYRVMTASTKIGNYIGKLGGEAHVDLLFSEIYALDYEAIVFVGGPGILTLWDDTRAHELSRIFFDKGKKVCAICSAPVILARAGLLNGKKCTCFSKDELELTHQGGIYTGSKTEVDGNIITGNGPEASRDFANLILKELSK